MTLIIVFFLILSLLIDLGVFVMYLHKFRIDLPLKISKLDGDIPCEPEALGKLKKYNDFLLKNGFRYDSAYEFKRKSKLSVFFVEYISNDNFIVATITILKNIVTLSFETEFENGTVLIVSDGYERYFRDEVIFLFRNLLPEELLKEHLVISSLMDLRKKKLHSYTIEDLRDSINKEIDASVKRKKYFKLKNYAIPRFLHGMKFLFRVVNDTKNKDELLKHYAGNYLRRIHEIDSDLLLKKFLEENKENNDIAEKKENVEKVENISAQNDEPLILKGSQLSLIGIIFLLPVFMVIVYKDFFKNGGNGLKSHLMISFLIFILSALFLYFLNPYEYFVADGKVTIRVKFFRLFYKEFKYDISDFELIKSEKRSKYGIYYELRLLNRKIWLFNSIKFFSTRDADKYRNYLSLLKKNHKSIYERLSDGKDCYKPYVIFGGYFIFILVSVVKFLH